MEINFKDFKDRVRESLAGKAYNRLEEIYKEFSSNIFEDNEEDFEEYPNSDKEVQGPGGEFLVDLEFKESDTKLKNFRVVAINKEDALSRLNNMFGKKSFKVTKIELEPNYDYKKTDKMLGRVKESLEESKKEDKKAGRKLKGIMTDPTYNATDPKNTSSFKASEPVSEETLEESQKLTEGAILKKILKNKKHGN